MDYKKIYTNRKIWLSFYYLRLWNNGNKEVNLQEFLLLKIRNLLVDIILAQSALINAKQPSTKVLIDT